MYSVLSHGLTCCSLKPLHSPFDSEVCHSVLMLACPFASGVLSGKTVGDDLPTFLISLLLCGYTGAVSWSCLPMHAPLQDCEVTAETLGLNLLSCMSVSP